MGEVSLQQIGLFLFLVPLVIADLTSEYDHAAYLDTEENYKLYWSVKDANKSIYFATEVKTLGWVGFGISVGLSGNMKSADMVVGWVDSQGKGHLQVTLHIYRPGHRNMSRRVISRPPHWRRM